MITSSLPSSSSDLRRPPAARSATSCDEVIILHGDMQAGDGTELIGLRATSPVVTSLDFLDWRRRGPDDLMITSRNTFIGVISPAFRVTPDEDAILSLQDTSVLVHELTTNKISLAVNALSLAGLFAVFYTTQLSPSRELLLRSCRASVTRRTSPSPHPISTSKKTTSMVITKASTLWRVSGGATSLAPTG